MVSTKVLLLQLLLVLVVSVVSVLPDKLAVRFLGTRASYRYIGQNSDGTHKVRFLLKDTSNFCDKNVTWECSSGECGQISGEDRTIICSSNNGPSFRPFWCETETVVTRNIPSDKPFKLRADECCWFKPNLGSKKITGLIALNLGIRSDTGEPNKSPVVAILPFLRLPKNCPRKYKMIPFDADGDKVRCRYGIAKKQECDKCNQPFGFDLDQKSCVLSYKPIHFTGIYKVEGVVEDYTEDQVKMKYANDPNSQKAENKRESPLSVQPLQFTVEVTDDAPSCDDGIFIPKFVLPTPGHGQKIQAEINKALEFQVKAQASHSEIVDIIVSGPSGIKKHNISINEFVIKWTPTVDYVGDYVPICFAVESAVKVYGDTHKKVVSGKKKLKKADFYQSEMCCVMVEVKDKIVKSHVTCDESSMTIVVEKTSFPRLNEDHLQLNDPYNTDCSLTSNGTHFIGVVPLNKCGTELEETDEFLIFKNEITTYEDPYHMITRKHLLAVDFFCKYPKHGNVSQSFSVHRKNVTVWEKGMGTFTYEFEFFTDDKYKTMIDSNLFPLEVKIGSRIFMRIKATSSLNNTELFVKSCTAAPYDNPNYPKPYIIIADGCEVDPTINIYETEHKNEYLYSLEAFKFIGLHDQVYISCSVVMCEAGNPNTRCAEGCINSTTSHSLLKRDTKVQSGTHSVSQGPLRLKRSAENSDSSEIALNLNLVFIAGCVLAAVGMICGVIMYKTKASKVDYQALPASESF